MTKRFLLPLLFSSVLLFTLGCADQTEQPGENATQSAPATAIPTEISQATETAEADAAASPEPTAESEVSSTATIQPSATADTRPLPEEWRTWPVIPTLSPAMIEVYQQGQTLGSRQNAFSKVGDCQIIPEVFLGLFEDPVYILPDRIEHLQGTLDLFQGSFAREGYSLKGGFVFPTVFSPLRADSAVCDPGETPFECELRVHQPSFVLISMEFRYEGRTADTHETYLRKAVEYALSRGIVPILATKADNVEGDHSLNLKTVEIAYEYDLPLWNYWLAVQGLPHHGLDPVEIEGWGFHTSPEAWLMRSETFLKVLDALYHQAQASQ